MSVRAFKDTLRHLPGGEAIIAVLRAVYRFGLRLAHRTMRRYMRASSRAKGYKTFEFSGFTIREASTDIYAESAATGSLREFVSISDGVKRLVAEHRPVAEPVFFDVGANIGMYTLLYSRVPGARVFGFEPAKGPHSFLTENIRANRLANAQAFNFGLSDSKQELSMGLPAGADYSAALTVYPADGAARETASFTTMDDFCRDHGITRVDFAKIDVEGHEFAVLSGGRGIIAASRPIMHIEVCPGRQQPERVFAFLAEYGYTAHLRKGGEFFAVTYEEWQQLCGGDPDVFCVPK